jgi:long-chain acyl-CoA synthetase
MASMEAKPWLRHYDSHVPATLQPYPRRTLLDFVAETARERPGHPFLLITGARLSYGEVDRLSDAFAAALAKRGIRRGDRVALVLPNCPQAVICQLGAWKAGAVVLFLNPLYTAGELEPIVRHTRPAAAVVLTPFYEKLKALQAESGLRLVVATNIKEYLPPSLRVLFTLFREKKEGHRVVLRNGDCWLPALLSEHAGARRPDVAVGCEDPALLLCTGGTTGAPKAAVQSHHALVIAGLQIHTWARAALPPWTAVVILAMPLFHTYGNTGGLSAVIVARGAASLVPNARDIDDLVNTVHKVRPTTLPGIPTLFTALLEHPKVKKGKIDMRSIKACTSGAAPLMIETKRRFEAQTGGKLIEGYALTESAMALVANPVDGLNKPGSIGIPVPDVDVRIVDAEVGGRELAVGQVGEIVMRAPNLMLGYWDAPEETAEALRDGWLYTGDLGYMDEDGYVFIVDRKKDVIKPSGFQVWPREVEETIASHPAVLEVAVAGIPDARQSEAVKAWVVLKKGATADSQEIRAFCHERLVAYKVPRQVEFRDALPKTMIGKVLRCALREEEISRAAAASPKPEAP